MNVFIALKGTQFLNFTCMFAIKILVGGGGGGFKPSYGIPIQRDTNIGQLITFNTVSKMYHGTGSL